ncbi:MAG: hypothetical protein ACREHF_03050 [Rhizomicrobium sp.]
MSSADNPQIARRPLLKGLLAAAGLFAAAAVAFEVPRLLAHHYPPTPFDDLFALLPDRDIAARVGAAAVVNPHTPSAALARTLRERIGGHSLGTILDADLAEARLSEVRGWVLPETLVQLCVLVARAGS